MAELGLTLIIAAGVGATVAIGLAAMGYDKALQRLMPEPMPMFDFASPALIVSLLLTGGCGWLLWRAGNRRT